jgi:cytochrome c oxidase assembly factor CtaG
VIYAAAAVGLALYAQGFARLRRRRPSLAPAWAACCFAAGVTVAVGALVSPLDRIAEERSLTAHMVQHLLLGDVAPLLLAAGLAGPRVLHALPTGALRTLARVRVLRCCLRVVFLPPVSLGLWVIAVYAWHVPTLYDAAVSHAAVHAAEHACFFAAGLLVWTQVLDRRRTPGRRAAFAGAVLLAGMPLAELLISGAATYGRYPGIAGELHAGLAMMAEQVATFGTAALLLLRAHSERVQPPEAEKCCQSGEALQRPPHCQPSAANAATSTPPETAMPRRAIVRST